MTIATTTAIGSVTSGVPSTSSALRTWSSSGVGVHPPRPGLDARDSDGDRHVDSRSGGELSAASVRARPQAINLVTALLVPTGWRPMRGVMGFAGTSMPPVPRDSIQPPERLKHRVRWA
ncbi:hypothetical protein, partial [Actinomadura sp. HBU206391]|uniref:hypothetical protein n=1 Tax=Actinomadura sp. HBU206391 TaxID=2731692 RepID=UPI00164FD3A1